MNVYLHGKWGRKRIEFRIGIRLFTYLFDYLH